MPCYDDREDGPSLAAHEATRAACDLAQRLRLWLPGTWRLQLSDDTIRWIEAHDREDTEFERRKKEAAKREAQRVKAIAKLTPDERMLLGL